MAKPMPKATKNNSGNNSGQADYAALSLELDELLAKLQQPGINVDEAIKLYGQGLELIEQLESHLEQAENKIGQLKLAATRAAHSTDQGKEEK